MEATRFDSTDEFEVPADTYEEAGKRWLTPSPQSQVGQKTGKNGGPSGPTQQWQEQLTITKIVADRPNKPYANSEPGDEAGQFHIQINSKVHMDSTWYESGDSDIEGQEDGADIPSRNIGKNVTVFLRFSMRALKNRPQSGHGGMTERSISTLKALISAAGADPQLGVNPVVFAQDHAEEVVGADVVGIIKQGPHHQNVGERNDEIVRFLSTDILDG